MKKNKGFTLVELLVVIVILGIITGLSIPLIRNLSGTMEKKKYTTYNETLLSGAKLYNDSYSEDLFGHNENGCAYVTYAQLKERNLLKDIEISDVSCDSDSTFVRILKIGDKYAYSPFLGCGKKKNGKANSIDTTLPIANQENVMKPEYCTGTEENNLEISALIGSDANSMNKKRKKTKLTITSATGINTKMSLSVKWSTNENDHDGTFEKVDFKVPGDQKEKMLNGEIISTTSNELITPAGKTGEYYLIVKVDLLQDLYGSKWKNPDGTSSKYVSFGPFVIDNEPPTVPVITAYVKTSAKNITSEGKLSTIKTDNWSNKWIFTKPKSTDNSGKSITYYYTTTGKTTNNTDTKGSYRNINDEGKSNIKYKACDIAGNCSEYSEDFIIKLDRTKPTCGTASGASKTWTKDDRTIKQACSDKLDNDATQASGCEKTSYDTTYKETKKTDTVTIKDNAENSNTCTYNVYVDKTNPTQPTITNPKNGDWTKSNFSLTLESTDAHSGINYYQYTYNANATTTGNNHDTTWVTYPNSDKEKFTTTEFSAERNQYVYVRSCDVAGNCSDKNKTYIRIDKTKPECTYIAKKGSSLGSDYNGGLTCSNIYTSASCADSGSGCDYKTITTTGATKNVTNETNTSWTVEAKGTSYVTWKVYDKAKNSKKCSKITIKKGTESRISSCGCEKYNQIKSSCKTWGGWVDKVCYGTGSNCYSNKPSDTMDYKYKCESRGGCNQMLRQSTCTAYNYSNGSCETYKSCCHE